MELKLIFPLRSLARKKSKTSGFTLLELLFTLAIIGILSAIVAPAWSAFLDNQSLNTAQNQVYRALQEAKNSAVHQKLDWQVSFREQNGISQLAIHPQVSNLMLLNWQNLSSKVKIDDAETTLVQSTSIWRVQFNYKGNVNGQLGRLTLALRRGGKAKRCVITSTLIGAIRMSKENPSPQNGRFCY